MNHVHGLDMVNMPHDEVRLRIAGLLKGEDDWVTAMATVVCELHHAFDHFHWTGFYRTVRPEHLKVGPYQGGHGCLDIPFDLGICGAAARTATTQDVPNVHVRPEHIACSSSTNSEVVVPVIAPSGQVIAVLDVDSDDLAAFEANDVALLEAVCKDLGQRYGETVVARIPGLA
jgi:GAF domain-containing protein